MIRIIFLLLFALVVGNPQSFAQTASDAPVKRFALRIGTDITNMNFNKGVPAPEPPVDAVWKTGITAGFSVQIPLVNRLYLQPEYVYTRRSGFDKRVAKSYHADYFSLPILLRYQLSYPLSVVAGPQAELLINAKAKSNGASTDITHDMEERSIAFTAGLNLRIRKEFFVSARYIQGLNHIGIGQRSEVTEFKYQVISLTAGIQF